MSHSTQKSSARKPRVAMLVAGDKFGGAERQLLTLCAAGTELFESQIFQTLAGPLTRSAERAGLPVRRELEEKSLVASGRQLARILADEQFDVVHTHGYRSATIAGLASLFGKRRSVVRTFHGAPEIFGAGSMGVKELIGRAAGFYSGAKSVFVSQELVQKMQGGRRAVVIYNGVNVDIAKGSRPPEYGSRVNLVAVGRLEPVKGLQYLIEAVSDPVLRSRVHLHLVGEGPELNGLQDLVMRKQLGSVVSFHGFKANSTDYIAHADILVLPSLHEGVPYVLLEALALKTPVMASEVGGIPEIVRHRKEAVLFSAGSADELARVLRQTIPDAELLAGMRSAGYFRVNSQFSAKAMTERYAALYASLGA